MKFIISLAKPWSFSKDVKKPAQWAAINEQNWLDMTYWHYFILESSLKNKVLSVL